MKIIGIIVEYNPFHDGHVNHIKKAKELFKNQNTIVVAVMSGNVVQRGEFAIFNKFERAKMALDNGVDLIFQLPAYYSLNSANLFAKGSIEILNKFGVDVIIFGSESDNIERLNQISTKLNDDKFQQLLKGEIKKTQSYPKAFENLSGESLSSNDILGINYIHWGNKINHSIELLTIQRDNENYATASQLRNKIENKETTPISYRGKVVSMNNFVPYFIFWIQSNELDDPTFKYFKNKINKLKSTNINWNDFKSHLNNKSMTNAKVGRELLKMIIGIKNDSLNIVRLLGFSNKGQKFLSTLKEKPYSSKYIESFKEELKLAKLMDLVLNTYFVEIETKELLIKK